MSDPFNAVPWFILFAVAAFGLVFAVGIFSYLQNKKRREAIVAMSAKHEWTYVERDDSWVDRFEGPPFGRGRDRRATNIVSGKYEGRFFVAFDYRYSTESTSTDSQGRTSTSTQYHHYSVTALDLATDFPLLSVEPEGMFSRLIGRLTNSDIELESEAFNRAFRVTCPDRKFASDVLNPAMMEYLLAYPTLAWGCAGGGLVAIRQGTHSPEEIEAKLGVLHEIAAKIPAFVWQQYSAKDSL